MAGVAQLNLFDELKPELEISEAFEDGGEGEGTGPVDRVANTEDDNQPQEGEESGQPDPALSESTPLVDPNALTTELRGLREQLELVRAENVLLRTQPQSEAPKPSKPSKEELLKQLSEDPLGTIEMIAEQAADRARREVLEKTGQDATARQQFEQERQQVSVAFPELGSDPEFQQSAMQIYNLVVRERGYFPGALALAVGAADSARVRRQRMPTQPAKPDLTVVPKPKIPSPVLGKHPTTTPASPETTAFNELSPNEQRAVQAVCKQWGLSVESYMKRYNALKAKDPNYGTGL